ncbi:MAG: hypothetical protein Alpg2KO_00490 [Alphaproteobacteria bacterium]
MTGEILTQLTGPDGWPVTLADMYRELRLDPEGDPPTHPEDNQLTDLIAAATGQVDGPDGILGRALLTQRWQLILPGFPPETILLPLPPLQSVEAVRVRQSDHSWLELETDAYQLVPHELGQALRPADGTDWPSTVTHDQAVQIDFTCGYGEAADVPMPVRSAIRRLVAHLFWGREEAGDMPISLGRLLGSYRVYL